MTLLCLNSFVSTLYTCFEDVAGHKNSNFSQQFLPAVQTTAVCLCVNYRSYGPVKVIYVVQVHVVVNFYSKLNFSFHMFLYIHYYTLQRNVCTN